MWYYIIVRGDNQMSKYGELIERVKEIPIVEYAQSCGYTLVQMGTYFSLKEYDSVRINPRKNLFWRNSNGVSGSIIDFVMEFESCSFDEAVRKLADRYGIDAGECTEEVKKTAEKPKQENLPKWKAYEPNQLTYPKAGKSNTDVFHYLTKSRCIEKEVVKYFFAKKLVYQDKYGNCVFATKDYACCKKFMDGKFSWDVKGCNYNECFFIEGENSERLIVTEAIIDIMAIMTFFQNSGIDFRKYNYLALNGTGKYKSVFYHLEKRAFIKEVITAFDFDDAGQKTAKRVEDGIKAEYPDRRVKSVFPPSGKDWDEYLQRMNGVIA